LPLEGGKFALSFVEIFSSTLEVGILWGKEEKFRWLVDELMGCVLNTT